MAGPPPARKEGDAAEPTDPGAKSLLTDEGPTAARLSFKVPHDTVRDEPPLRPGDVTGKPDGGKSEPRSDSGVVLRSGADEPADDKAGDDDEPPTILRRAVGTSTAGGIGPVGDERTLVELSKNPERPSPPPRAPELEMPTPAQPLSYAAAVRSLGAAVDADPDDPTEVETLRVSGPQMPLAPIESAMMSPPPAQLPTAPAAATAPPAAAMSPAAAKVIAAALAPQGARAAAAAVAIAAGKPLAPAASRPAPVPATSAPAPASPSAAAAPAPAGVLPLHRPKTATLEDLSSAPPPPPPTPTPAHVPTPEELDAAAERLSHPPVPEMPRPPVPETPRPRVATETIPLQLPISDRSLLLAFVGGVALASFVAGLLVRGCFVDEVPPPAQSAGAGSPPVHAPAAPAPAVERPARSATPPPAPHARPATPPAKAPAAATPRPPVPPRKASPPPVVRRTPSAPPRTQPAPRTPPASRSASPPPRRVTATKRAPAPTKSTSTPPPRATNRRQGPAQPGGFLRKAPF